MTDPREVLETIQRRKELEQKMEVGMENVAHSKPQFELMESLNTELNRYDRIIDMAEAVLSPVIMESSPDPDTARPQEAPYSDLHRAIQRLDHLNYRMENLRSRIRL